MTPDAQRYLRALVDASGGDVSPDAVIEVARDPTNPLHSEFQWDIDEAALQHWRQQARRLIQQVRVEIINETEILAIPAYYRDTTKRGGEQGYVSIGKIMSDEDRRRDTVVAEFKRAASAVKRAQAIAKAFGVDDAVEAILSDLQIAIVRLEQAEPAGSA